MFYFRGGCSYPVVIVAVWGSCAHSEWVTGVRVWQHARYMNAGALSSILAAKKKAAAISDVSELSLGLQ